VRLTDKPATIWETVAQLQRKVETLEYRIADLETCNNFAIALIRERGGDG
jgi:hypothetical protein